MLDRSGLECISDFPGVGWHVLFNSTRWRSSDLEQQKEASRGSAKLGVTRHSQPVKTPHPQVSTVRFTGGLRPESRPTHPLKWQLQTGSIPTACCRPLPHQRNLDFRLPDRFRLVDGIVSVPLGKREATLAAEGRPGGGGRVMMEISVFGLSMGSHFGRRNEGARRRGRPGSLWGIMVRDWQKLYVVVTNTPTTNHTHRPSSDLCERSTADLPPTQPPIGPDALPLPQSRHPAARSNLSSGRACGTRFSHRNHGKRRRSPKLALRMPLPEV